MRTATKQEAINGNSNDTVITPLRLKQVLDTVDINPGEGGGGSDTPVYTAGAGISITNNVITNTITKTSQLTNDSNFITEADLPDININDPVPINSIWDYEGDTVPDGFIEVEEEQVVVEETDPTVPSHVKAITEEDIAKWNSGTGGSGGSLEIETIIINPKNATNEQGGKIYEVGRVQKCGNECKLILTSSAGYNIPNATYTVIGVIPEGYRPKETVAFVASARQTDYANFYDFVVVVYTTGDISVLQRTGSSFHVGDIRGSVSYYIDEPLQLPGGGGSGSGEISIDGDITTNNNTRLKDNNYNVITINHRGYNTIAPENTLPAYVMSKEKGYNYVECDVSFTSDGIPVLLHDDTIDRTSNGSGRVSNLTYNQLLQYDFGSWKSSEYTGTKIPTFEEFIVLCKNIGLYPYIELKSNGNYTREQIVEIVNIVKKCGMQGNVTYISFNIDYLEYVNSVDKQARLGYLLWEINETEINKVIKLSSGINEVFIDAPYTNLANTGIELCIKNNIPLEMWSVNDADIIKNMNSYISGVTSDSLIASQILNSNYGINSEETDPTVPAHVKAITLEDIAKWNSGTGSGGSISEETDPIFSSSPAANITEEDIAKWNNASGDGSSLEIYSTEEIVIGTFLGKPLYRKVCSFNPPNFYNGLAEVVTNILNCDVMITQKLFWFDSAAKVWRTFPGNYHATNDWDTQNSFAPQTGGIRMEVGTNAATRIKEKATRIYAILEYTKTTD